MAKTKTQEAQTRAELKRAAAVRDREGLATLSAAATALKSAGLFVDIDFALGLMMHAADLSAAKKEKIVEAGRAVRLSLLPTVTEGQHTNDLVVRVPADLRTLPEVTEQLLQLGLRANRKRAASAFAEFHGAADEDAVRIVVDAVGGTVTAIQSPPHGTAETTKSDLGDAGDGSPGADKSQAAPEAPGGEIIVLETDPTLPVEESGRDREAEAVALDNRDFGDHTHPHHNWHHESDAGRGSSA